MKLRVLLADDDAFVRTVTARLLAAQPGIEIVGEAASAQEALELARTLEPDVALLDVNMPGGGVEAAQAIANECPEVVTVAYSATADGPLEEMRSAGVSAYILKGTPGDQLAARLRDAVTQPAA